MAPARATRGVSLKQLAFALAASVAVIAVAGCASTPKKTASRSSTKEYFSEKKYGVKASPRVADAGEKVRKGGGRYHVGKPYKVAGKWYRPKHQPNYSKTGRASWYGSAFHGRLTANGEVYDMNSLTAAHPTLPLPSYVRVTNLANNRSVVVRVNDRGPFHGKRVIDLSKRAAEMLDYKSKGVAKVHVDYVGKAPLHGRDTEYLVASYRGPGQRSIGDELPAGITAPGTTVPGTMLARIDDLAPVAANSGRLPMPPMRPFTVPAQTVMVAYDPATAFSQPNPNSGVMVASLENAAPAEMAGEAESALPKIDEPAAQKPEEPRRLSSATSTYSPDTLSQPELPAGPRPDVDARSVRTVAINAPVSAKPARADVVSVKTVRTASVEAAPVRTVGAPPRNLGTLPASAVGGTGGPFHPLPPASVGSSASVKGPMVLISSGSTSSPTVAGALFFAPNQRISAAHQMVASVASDSIPLSALAERQEKMRVANATPSHEKVQVGVFGDSANVARLERKLARFGTVESRPVSMNGQMLTAVTVAAFAPGIRADDAVRAAEALGARGARIVRDGN
ncbi:MAG: septal ring lytic transglycosylase RlpA family protein [Hyphomicrobiales bacterium]|nr:MAG: septal ring lytic transglycosylase RlpA family protein [Hyphomicrobiales bacterium]